MYLVLKQYSASMTILLVIAIFSSSITIVYGHGLGTDRSLPVTISGKQLSVEASLNPTFLDEVSDSKPVFMVRTVDDTTNSTISSIDMRIVVELNNQT
ncbi:MAG: hypothetical protein M3146_09110, partial [Thermoproteota archaeon]|nr:hypothetical protein [Thermoproteota archaeon]